MKNFLNVCYEEFRHFVRAAFGGLFGGFIVFYLIKFPTDILLLFIGMLILAAVIFFAWAFVIYIDKKVIVK